MENKRQNIKRMVMLALFCAIAFATMFVLRIQVSFLTFDTKDAVITIAAMLFGPASGAIISLVVATLELITVSDTGFYGWVMNFCSSAVFSVLASAIYRRSRKMRSAVIGLLSAILGMPAMMILLNLLVTPFYTGWAVAEVAAIIPTLLLPFNFIKATLNAALVMILYKPISLAMKKAKITGSASVGGEGKALPWRSIVFTLVGLAVAIICVVVFIQLMGGDFSLFKSAA